MADENVIGGVKVEITGDYSQLEADFDQAVSIATTAGQGVADAFQNIADAGQQTEASLENLFGIEFDQRAYDAAGAVEFLDADLQNFNADAIIATAAAESAASGLESVDSAASGAASAEGAAASGAQQLAQDTAAAAASTDTLSSSLLELASVGLGVYSGIAAVSVLKSIAEDSVLAYGAVQQLTTSMALLGSGADGAAGEVEKLRDLSNQLAIPFDELGNAARKLAAAFGTGDGLTAVLIAAGNVAAATGQSFTSVSSALERIELTGAVTARQLVALGLSWKDMADAMGVSVEEAQQRMKKGGQDAAQDVADTIDAINAKFGDAAEQQSQNVLGQLTKLGNQVKALFAEIGEDLAPAIGAISEALKVISSGWALMTGGIKTSIDVIVGWAREATTGLSGVATVAADLLKGNIAGAVTDAKNTMTLMGDIDRQTNQAIITDTLDTTIKLNSIWSESGAKITATFKGGGDAAETALKPVKEFGKQIKEMSDGVAVLAAQEKLEIAARQAVIKETATFNEQMGTSLTALDYLALKVAAATDAFTGLADSKFFSERDALQSDIQDVTTVMDALDESITNAQQAALDTSPYAKLESALESLGITSAQSYKDQVNIAKQAYDDILASGVATDNELAQAALILSQKEILAAIEAGDATVEEYQSVLAQIQTDLDSLDAATAVSASNRGKTEKTLGDEIQAINKKTFDSLEKGLATDIVQQKGWAATIKDLWQHLAEDLLNIMFKVLLDPLEKDLAGLLGGIFPTATQGAGGAASGAAGAAGGAGSAASGAAGAASSSVTGILTSVFTGISAITSVLSFFGLGSQGHMENDLQKIEESTRYLKIGVVTQADSIFYSAAVSRDTLLAIKDYFWGTQATYLQGISIKLDQIISMGGLGAGKGGSGSSIGIGGAMAVHIDLRGANLSGNLTDTQVQQTFDRAFRRSKLAGAFNPGTWPQ